MDSIDLTAWPFEIPGLDSGFRRRDDFEASFLSSFRRKPESSGIKEEFDVYTIMALLVIPDSAIYIPQSEKR
jgi:hypothetical protein